MFYILDLCSSREMRDPYGNCKTKGTVSLFGLFLPVMSAVLAAECNYSNQYSSA
jgi:hypothetical protein